LFLLPSILHMPPSNRGHGDQAENIQTKTTTVARMTLSEWPARRLADALAEIIDPRAAIVSAREPGDGRWTVAVYFHSAPDRRTIRHVVASIGGATTARALTFETVAEKDWVAASLAGLRPVAAGRFVLHGRHDRARIALNRVGIEIEAALAFGTGHHGTTRGCLLALDRMAKARRPRRVLDVGTGSGVLAIAAAKASRRRVVASDVDPRAVAAARENARTNGVGALVEVIRAGGLIDRRFRSRAPYDLVLANILLEPLKRLAVPLARLAARGGRVVLSGLLPAQANAALAAYRTQRLTLERRIVLDGWVTLVLARR
jgi:ribosomal protein L11 methyltransferase